MSEENKETALNEENSASVSEQPQDESCCSGALIQQIATLQGEVEANKDAYVRAVAELENYKKKAFRDKDEARKSAVIGVVEMMLPVLDSLNLGLQAAKQANETSDIVKGFEMVGAQMKTVFGELGLEELNPEGQSFDPNKHECISHIPHESIEENKVIQVTRFGYAIKERLLRPAYVVVSSGAPQENTEN